jgi:hypothetical protein
MNSPFAPYGMNPYAAPQAGFASMPVGSHGGALKWLYLGALLGSIVFYGAGVVLADAGSDGGGAAGLVGAVAIFAAVGFFIARYVLGLVWLYKSWSAIPPQFRMNRSGRVISPGQAVGYLFIPFYNLYWVFAANLGMCDAVDFALHASGSHERAPRGMVMAACICQVIPYANILIAPFLWFFAMLTVDRAKDSMVVALANARRW